MAIKTDPLQIRDCFDNEIRKAAEKTAALEAEVEKFDRLFEDANAAHVAALQLLQEAKSELEIVVDSRKEIQSRHDSVAQERHELQVWNYP